MSSHKTPLLIHTELGLYCPEADVFLDPWRPVQRALITHAHADHARPGSGSYVTHRLSVPLLHQRLGTTPNQVHGLEYGEVHTIRGVRFSFHPAGHVPGSAQILVESRGERWVFSGDYKTEDDGFTTPIEAVRCDTFISECTFGLPIFSWRPQREVFEEIHSWWCSNREEGYASVIAAYALGKAQRVLTNLNRSIGPVFVHPAIHRLNQVLGLNQVLALESKSPDAPTSVTKSEYPLVLVPPAVLGTPWLKRFGEHRTAAVSGWMAISGMRRRRGVDKGFVLSDHADFAGLNRIIEATGAQQVFLTHGYTAQFGRYLSERHPLVKVAELGMEFALEAEG
jgi:putative mRNA 3-end processing factor